MTDIPLWRTGRVILKVRNRPDGSVLVYKPFLIKEEHIMRLTGAPGWDQVHVDATFSDGVVGTLRWQQEIVQYDIAIKAFREHAFLKDGLGGPQYHVHRKFYASTGLRTVDPIRRSAEPTAAELPRNMAFGEWVPCSRCGSKGTEPDKRSERCSKCQGLGFLKWSSSSATS